MDDVEERPFGRCNHVTTDLFFFRGDEGLAGSARNLGNLFLGRRSSHFAKISLSLCE